MPLSKPAPRKHIHTRAIECRAFEREDGLWDIEGRMTDIKTYSFDNHDRGGIAAGEPIHDMSVRLTVDPDLVIHAAEASSDAGPYSLCSDIVGVFDGLVGLQIGRGWRKNVTAVMGRTKGCTHLTDLIQGPMAVTAFQAIGHARQARNRAGSGGRPLTLDTCHALAADGPIVKRQWPEFYTGPDGGDEE